MCCRYFLKFPTCQETIILTWDEDGTASRDLAIGILFAFDDGTATFGIIDKVSKVTLALS